MPTCTACEILRVASAALLQNQVSAARLTLLAQTWRECSPAQGGGAACDGTLYTEWSTAFTRWMNLACGMAMRNLIAKAGIVRLDTSGGTVIVHQYLLSPIAPSISSNYTCVVSPTYYPPTFISTWRTWKVGITNHIMEQLLEDPAWPVRIGGPFAVIRASRVLLAFLRFSKSSRNRKRTFVLRLPRREAAWDE